MTEITYAGRIPALPSRNSYTSIMIIISAFVRCMSLCATRSARLDDPTQLTAQGGIDMMRRHIPGRRHVSALRWGGTEHSDGWRKSSRRGAAASKRRFRGKNDLTSTVHYRGRRCRNAACVASGRPSKKSENNFHALFPKNSHGKVTTFLDVLELLPL